MKTVTEEILERLVLKDFRNYHAAEVPFQAGFNVAYGENGQGKTNLLEAIHWLLTGRSPRTRYPGELLRFGAPSLSVTGIFREGERQLHRNRSYPGRRVKGEEFPAAVYFGPGDLALVQGGPAERRRYLNLDPGQASPLYRQQLLQLGKVLTERQAWLKRAQGPAGDMWEALDQQFVAAACPVLRWRATAVADLTPDAARLWSHFRPGETLSLDYRPGVPDSTPEGFRRALVASRAEEWRRRLTVVGPQRDDLELLVNGRELRRYGSQGQARTAAIVLKLAAVTYLTAHLEAAPLLLLDDVLSELDPIRRRALLEFPLVRQVILTTTDRLEVPELVRVKEYLRVIDGRVESEV